MVESSAREKQEGALFLPPGFRFHPTDEEVITSYLLHKFFNPAFASRAVGDVDLNKCEPWDLPSKAKMGEKEWYFFCQKDMKYPTGMRANRATKEGYWKATGKDKEIFDKGGALVGMKKTLVFYMGRAPRGSNTSWVMHEFRLEGKSKDSTNLRANPKDEWVVCKVFHKKGAVRKAMDTGIAGATSIDGGGCGDDDFVDSVIDPTYYSPINFPNTSHGAPSAVAGSGGTSTSFFLPSYSFDTSNNQVVSNPIPSSTATVHGSSSWNMPMLPGPAHGMGSYLYQQDHTAMANALGGVIHPNFGFSKGLPVSPVVGVPPQNPVAVPQQKLGSYGSPYAS